MDETTETPERHRPRLRLSARRLVAGGLVAAVAISGVAAGLPSGQTAPLPRPAVADPTGTIPHPRRVAVLALENKSYGQVIGSPSAPYVNRLAKRSAVATNYYAVAHPSLPNYMALTGGSKFEISHNCTSCDTSAPNLVGQLSAAKVSWRAYFEGLTSNTRPGHTTTTYNPYYNPFVFFDSVRTKAKARSHIVGFDKLGKALQRGNLPRFSWIAPSVGHDGHNGSLRASDRYLSRLVPRVVHALGPNGVLYLTWDEGAAHDTAGVGGSRGGGHVVLLATGGAAQHATKITTPANHYALLRTIEAGFGLSTLGNAGSQTTPVLSGLLRR